MQNDKKNLLELCLSPDLGGLELYMMRCAKALTDSYSVMSVINPKGKLEQYFCDSEHKYEMVEKKSNLLMFSAAHKLAKIIDENSIDIVHLHWTKDIPIAVLAKHLSKRKPKLVQTRNMTMTRFKDDFYHRHLYKNIDMMLPVTKQVAAQLERFIPESVRPKVEVLYMGTDKIELLAEEERIQLRVELGMDKSFAVGLVGRIEETKGQHLLIEAVSILRQKDLNVEAFFVGHAMQEGYIDSLKEKAEKSGIASSVHFLGFMKNPMHFMQACDAMVLATPCETFGLVVIEAMAAKTAMVATKQCGPMEIIEDGIDGLLFENGDVDSLASKIEQLASDSVLTKRMTDKALAVVEERFETGKQFAKLSTLLKGVG
ncbi:MAG: glycosyltransferase family 4 protein [Sulfurimonadaceae bacterium]